MAEAVVFDSYRKRLAACMAGGPPISPITGMAFGSGGHKADGSPKAPDSTGNGLGHELFRKPIALVTQNDDFSVTAKGILEPGELIGSGISEAMLVDANGKEVGIKTFGLKTKEGDEVYEITINLRF